MIQTVDFAILDWIQTYLRNPVCDFLLPKITVLGNKGIIWIVIAITLLVIGKKTPALEMIMGLVMGVLIGNIALKHLVARARPCWINTAVDMLVAVPKDYSFPSGHSMSSFCCAMILLHYNKKLGIPALILAIVIAFSRLYVYVHFPTDVLVGSVIGIIIGYFVPRIYEHFFVKEA
ncbi:MAG: phosphatase PAP2 family protein [Lachnospiraceae bacterium]|nr:phosphatase PAP2 family protein [Lachnospiraceae bacterium]